MPLEAYATKFLELIVVPWKHLGWAWGILPVYTTLLLGEIYTKKISNGHVVGTGFVFLWTGLNWAGHLYRRGPTLRVESLPWVVTIVALVVAAALIVIGFRKMFANAYPIIGHPRFGCYFLILLYPLQMHLVPWNWTAVNAILIFAAPTWLLLVLIFQGIVKLAT